MNGYSQRFRRAMSLLELIAVVTILGIIAAVAMPRFGDQSKLSRNKACHLNKANIEVQCQLWFRQKGSWPASDLSNIGADVNYFPGGMPTCPVDNSTYQFDPNTKKIIGHTH